MRPPTGRTPTIHELEMIDYLLGQAGSERELCGWIKKRAGPHRQRGRPPDSSPFAQNDEDALLMAETLHLMAKTFGKNTSLHKAIKLVVSQGAGNSFRLNLLGLIGED